MTGKTILLVEGKDDLNVFKAIFGQRSLPHLTEINDHEGWTRLLEAIPVWLKDSGVEALGIVLDADTNVAGRWDSVRNRLSAASYVAPPQPDPQGLVLNSPPGAMLPRVGVWLMPNNVLPGILEDFLRCLVPQGSALFAYAERTVNEIPENLRLFKPIDRPKALIHTWLAWQSEPGRPLGQSITAGFLEHTAAEADNLVRWLQRLFFPLSSTP
jgi:hypothetical protein